MFVRKETPPRTVVVGFESLIYAQALPDLCGRNSKSKAVPKRNITPLFALKYFSTTPKRRVLIHINSLIKRQQRRNIFMDTFL
jgi:hypothetical protein